MEYEIAGYERSKIEIVEILIMGDSNDALTFLLHEVINYYT